MVGAKTGEVAIGRSFIFVLCADKCHWRSLSRKVTDDFFFFFFLVILAAVKKMVCRRQDGNREQDRRLF